MTAEILFGTLIKGVKMNQLTPVTIKRKTSKGIEPVYDISVPEQHHYVLSNGLVSHNSGFIYASSIVVAMRKLKLKVDADGNKTSTVNGIRAACKIMKTRYAKPFEAVQVEIPYSTGMSPYSGLVDLFETKGVLVKDGNRLKFTSVDGTETKLYRKEWERNEGGMLDTVMEEFDTLINKQQASVETEVESESEGEIEEHG
jgi:hypothetical protein